MCAYAPSPSCALASPIIAHLSLRHMHVSSLPTTRNSLIHVLIITLQNLDGFDPFGGRWVYHGTHRPHQPGGCTRATVDPAPTQFFSLLLARRPKENEPCDMAIYGRVHLPCIPKIFPLPPITSNL
jgi:hypothetical protein